MAAKTKLTSSDTIEHSAPTAIDDISIRSVSDGSPEAQEQIERRRARIEQAAYYNAERRGFAPGGELDDWLEAEREIDAIDVASRLAASEDAPPTDDADVRRGKVRVAQESSQSLNALVANERRTRM